MVRNVSLVQVKLNEFSFEKLQQLGILPFSAARTRCVQIRGTPLCEVLGRG